MNVHKDQGAIHHLVNETRRVLCGEREASFDGQGSATSAAVTCPACLRMLADDVRLAGRRTDDSED